jgi:solute carrier family 26 (sodium-independent sulfate anion transporter), member 11
MASSATKVGHGLAKVLGIDLHYRNETGSDRVTKGESVFSVESADAYVEHEPTAWEWIRETFPSGHEFLAYLYSLFPFVHWIGRYNLQWLIGDLVAGIFSRQYVC